MARTIYGNIEFATTYYVPAEKIRDYGYVSWSDLSTKSGHCLVPLTLIPDTYDGPYADSVQRSNYRSIVRDYGEQVIEIQYRDGNALGFIGRDDSTLLGDAVRKLALEYPLFDEEDHVWLEWEEQQEYLQNGGVADLRSETGETLDGIDNERLRFALADAVSNHPYGGDWDGTGYRCWDDLVQTATYNLLEEEENVLRGTTGA